MHGPTPKSLRDFGPLARRGLRTAKRVTAPRLLRGSNAVKDQLQFLRGAILRPRSVGAVAPSSPALARAIAREIDPDAPGRILELGPGTGAVTAALIARGIPASRITAVERDSRFARLLVHKFPGIEIIEGNAFALAHTLGDRKGFAAIVSSLPLLLHAPAERDQFVASALARMARGAPLVQFSYGFSMPVRPPAGAVVTRAAFVWKNLPPAQVWTYRNI